MELMLESGINFLPALVIDIGLCLVPYADKVFNLVDTSGIMILHLFDNGATTL